MAKYSVIRYNKKQLFSLSQLNREKTSSAYIDNRFMCLVLFL